VNPLALKYRQEIFIKNEQRVSIQDTERFGKLDYIEVSATCGGIETYISSLVILLLLKADL